MSNIERLASDIIRYAKAYYQGSPLISDSEFDSLVEELKVLDPKNPVLMEPGWGYKPEGIKYPHITQIGSLDKIKIETDESKRYILNTYKNNYVFTPKLDGGSAVAYYNNGKLDRVISRGDGYQGIDITLNVLMGNSIPLIVDPKIKAVRGEIIISKDNFEKYLSKDYANARNASTGISQSNQTENCQYLDFVTYAIIQSSFKSISYLEQLNILSNNGFKITPILNIKTMEDFDKYSPVSSNYDYDVDGIVVCNNNVSYTEEISIYDSIAIKYEAESAIVKVTGITWNKSVHGKLIPVINFEPIELSGAILSKCSGFSAQMIKDEGIGPNALIKVCRSNEVIPYWMDTIKSVNPQLPDCEYSWNGVHIEVDTDIEYNTVIAIISCSALFRAGNAPITFSDIYEVYTLDKLLRFIKSVEDNTLNYKLAESELGNGKRLQLAIDSIKNIDNVWTLQEVLSCVRIPSFGEKTVLILSKLNKQQLLKYLDNSFPEDILNDLPNYLSCNSLIEHSNFIAKVIRFIDSNFGIIDTSIENKSDKIKVAFTGKLSISRSEWIDKYNVEEVNIKEAQYLITNNPNSGSSKNNQADKLGIKKINESDFIKLLEL